MGVSLETNSTNLDLDAIVAGGDAFMTRVKTLQKAKAASTDALDALNIGRNVVEAMRDAQAKEAAALKMIEDAKVEAKEIIATATQRAGEIAGHAQEQAEALLTKAQRASEAVEEEVRVGRAALAAWSDKTTAEAQSLMSQAESAMAAAGKKAAENVKEAKRLADAQKETKAMQDAAEASRATFTAKIEAIKAAAS